MESSPLDGTLISEVRIVGLQRVDESYVRNQLRSQVGQPYAQGEVQGDRSRLLRTGRFYDVRAEPQLLDGRIVLTYTLVERQAILSVDYEGAYAFKRKKLDEALPFAAGDPLSLFMVRQGQEAIERLYKEKGYAYVEVTFDEKLAENEQRVVYLIVENQRVRVREVSFEGNTVFSKQELQGVVATKPYLPIFRAGDFDPDRAVRDAAAVQKYYRDRGYLDAEVGYRSEFEDVAREKLVVVFQVNEGTRYLVGELRLQGFNVFTEEELLTEMILKVGDPLLDARLQADVKRLTTLYGSHGYIYAHVVPSWVFAAEPGQVVVTLAFAEGQPFNIGDIQVRGNAHTQEKCVRRELRFYPEEIYDITKTQDAENRLKGTGLFTAATIEPVGDEQGVRDALVTVEENPQTTQFIAGVGASSNSGLIGNITLENTNFDITDWPKSWGEFFRGRAFRGAGQTMRISLNPGTELNSFRVDFREPYLMDKPIGFGAGVYLFDRDRDGYTEQRVGTTFSFDKRFEDGFLKGWAGEVAFRAEYVNVKDRQAFAAKDIRDVDGGNYLSTARLSLVHDTTDSRFTPSRGHRFRASWEQAGAMGGDFYHAKLGANYVQHWTVFVDENDRKSVVSARGEVNQILGDAPVFERYYAGGIGSMRGFNYRGISPRDGLRNNRVGGDFMALCGAEYSFPLYTDLIRGVFFTDMGTVERDFGISTWRMSIGGGIRLTLPIFGTIPMEFDLAAPISKGGDDDTQIFSFFIGLPFF